ncbi:MAG: hypothetical protein JHC26_03615 [Thermofilum sp.]|uniref:hypothetical protein n=1 Tax=Thermofilum sp. TaxID=1961369 RepID=UPI002582C2C6|nr:hypothetical protein [Thermofilum sp.]MCI4408156.1 hypothetical protein [Thermofilum sp.]
MHMRELFTAIAIFSIVALETVVLVPSLVIQLILILIFTGTLISYFSKSPLLLNVFTSAYCIFLALLGALNYPAGVLFAQIITILIIRDFFEILMYSEVRGVYYLARYYLPFYSVIILIFYLWVSISQELSKRLPIQAIVVATVGIVIIYIYAVRSLRRLD